MLVTETSFLFVSFVSFVTGSFLSVRAGSFKIRFGIYVSG